MPSTFDRMKRDIETGWDEVLWSESYGLGDAAALAACIYFSCAQAYLGARLRTLANKVGQDFLEQILQNKGKVLLGPGNLEVQAGDAYWSVYHRIWNPAKWRHEKVTTERYVRLYVRYRRQDAAPQPGTVDVFSVEPRFRAINDISHDLGYAGGFPNFHQADHGQGVVFGSILLKNEYVDWVDISREKLGNPDTLEARFRAVNDYAVGEGYRGGLPNFHQADYGEGVVYGTGLLKKSAADWQDISRAKLGKPATFEERFRAVNDYAFAHGYRGGFPNFHQADHGHGVVYGAILIRPEVADWRDISVPDLQSLDG